MPTVEICFQLRDAWEDKRKMGLREQRTSLMRRSDKEEWVRLSRIITAILQQKSRPIQPLIYPELSIFSTAQFPSTLPQHKNIIPQCNDRLLTFQARDQQELLLPPHPHQQVLPLLLHPADRHQPGSSHRSPAQLPGHRNRPRNHSLPAPRLRPVTPLRLRRNRCLLQVPPQHRRSIRLPHHPQHGGHRFPRPRAHPPSRRRHLPRVSRSQVHSPTVASR